MMILFFLFLLSPHFLFERERKRKKERKKFVYFWSIISPFLNSFSPHFFFLFFLFLPFSFFSFSFSSKIFFSLFWRKRKRKKKVSSSFVQIREKGERERRKSSHIPRQYLRYRHSILCCFVLSVSKFFCYQSSECSE